MEHTPTVDSVIEKYLSCTCHQGYKSSNVVDPSCLLHEYSEDIKLVAQEWASIETEHLRQENKTLIQRIKELEKIINQKLSP